MTLPRIVRILVIDDLAGKGALGETIRNVLYAMVKTCDAHGQLDYVDIEFADTPEEGVKKWQDQVFDLTLVDSDFGSLKGENEKPDGQVSSFLDFHARYKGVFAFHLLCSLSNAPEAYAYRAQSCRVCLWTSLGKNDVSKILSLASDVRKPGQRELPEPNDWYVGKMDRTKRALKEGKSFTTLQKVMRQVVTTALGSFTREQFAERFISVYKSRSRFPKDLLLPVPFVDGYLLLSEKRLPYLDCLNKRWRTGPYLYFTVRKPGNSHDFSANCILSSVYLGPASRDVNQPLGTAIAQLFRFPPTGPAEEANQAQPATQLSTNEQMALLYRIRSTNEQEGHEGKNERLAIRVPRPEKERSKEAPDGVVEAAATPLTGVSTVGLQDAKCVLIEKTKALLLGPFDRVVLKTTYLDAPGGLLRPYRWPSLQAQSHHRTRCLRSEGHPRTLWNTGATALEMFTPQMLNEFLRECVGQKHRHVFGDQGERLVVSLGSKYPQANQADCCYRGKDAIKHGSAFCHELASEIWGPLFTCVFAGLDGYYPTVEVNVRHYLRENIEFHIGGDEYMSPNQMGSGAKFTRSYRESLTEFGWWLEVLNATAMKRRVILKIPFRSDILAFIQAVFEFCKTYGNASSIKGICLINAFKTGVCEGAYAAPYTPAWYSRSSEWGDASGREEKYQMSGEMLNASRNMLLYKILSGRRTMGLNDFEVHFGGGIVSQDDLAFCRNPSEFIRGSRTESSVSVQIGTWSLLDLDLKKPLPKACLAAPPKSRQTKAIAVGVCNGRECPTCVKTLCSRDAIIVLNNDRISVNGAKCSMCGQCISRCPGHVFANTPPSGSATVSIGTLRTSRRPKTPIIEETRCTGCGACTNGAKRGCQKAVLELLPLPTCGDKKRAKVMNGSNCTECGRCVKACPQAAISLGQPDILPRICYLLHEQCIGCGKCSRSFYCDTFLDRRGENIHPLMDPRNCTGCGLCTQMCPTGALQLFKPEHVAVLVSGPGERSDLLKTLQIPHLTYDPVADLQLFGTPEDSRIRRARLLLENTSVFSPGALRRWAVSLWRYRLTHDLVPASFGTDTRWGWLNMSGDGTEKRRDLPVIAKEVAAKADVLLNKLAQYVDKSGVDPSVATRAFVWSQLIWSDPAQVLWECPIMVVRSTATIEGEETPTGSCPTTKEDVIFALETLGSRTFTVTTHTALLQAGELKECLTNMSGPFVLALDSVQIKAYAETAMLGQRRLLGLDLRACPNMLTSVAYRSRPLTAEEIISVSGLPWDGVAGLKHTTAIKAIMKEVDCRLGAVRGISS